LFVGNGDIPAFPDGSIIIPPGQLEHVSVLDSLNSLAFNTVFEGSGEDVDFRPDVQPAEVQAIFTKILTVSTHLSSLAARLYTDVILARRDLALCAFPSGMPALASSLRTAPFSPVGLFLFTVSREPCAVIPGPQSI
jgi:hypothetical protein